MTATPDLSNTVPIRWGILGTGRIAEKFVNDVQRAAEGAVVQAVGSRTRASADAFGDRFGIATRHASYEALAADPDVDVIYVATPHPWHKEATMLCLNAGKHVLCEKAFAMNAAQARMMVNLARRKQRFLMEAMWTRFRPATIRIRELLAAGAIGDPVAFAATIGWRGNNDPAHRLYDLAKGGGVLLDGTVYPVSFACHLFGMPEQIATVANLGPTGVDEQDAIAFVHANGVTSSILGTIRANPTNTASIVGTTGRIEMAPRWWQPEEITLLRDGHEPETFSWPEDGTLGYQYEAMAVGAAIRAGQLESAVMPLDESVAIMALMDDLRARWGLRYAADDAE
ncbi:MAG: Gfo/Idh/MocA family oxidoreductase [Thermomicrobiales bacterium]